MRKFLGWVIVLFICFCFSYAFGGECRKEWANYETVSKDIVSKMSLNEALGNSKEEKLVKRKNLEQLVREVDCFSFDLTKKLEKMKGQ